MKRVPCSFALLSLPESAFSEPLKAPSWFYELAVVNQ